MISCDLSVLLAEWSMFTIGLIMVALSVFAWVGMEIRYRRLHQKSLAIASEHERFWRDLRNVGEEIKVIVDTKREGQSLDR